jgi:glucose-6-phosphate dehydrogenase assembly protein OpcA
MTESSSDAFLEGQGIPVDLPQINTALEQLWGPAAERIGGPELEHPNVTRIVLANLVVERLTPEADALRQVLETVVAKFPCRTIVLRESDGPERKITAEVSAVCHLPDPGMPQVCSERIVLRAGPQALDLIPGAVRPLLEADLPLILWWTTDPTSHERLFRNLADESSRILLDLPDPGASAAAVKLGLDPSINACSRDAVWYGLAHWRELVARFFDSVDHLETLRRIDSVQIEALSPDASAPPRLALWLAAWLAGQLDWKTQGEPSLDATDSGSTLRARFEGPAGPLGVEIRTRPFPDARSADPKLMSVTITAHGQDGLETFRLERSAVDSPDIQIHADAPDYCRLPSTVNAECLEPARRAAAALELSRFDPPFEKALPFLLWLLETADRGCS